MRTGIEGFQRERELYLELVREYLEVMSFLQSSIMYVKRSDS